MKQVKAPPPPRRTPRGRLSHFSEASEVFFLVPTANNDKGLGCCFILHKDALLGVLGSFNTPDYSPRCFPGLGN